MTGRLDNRSIGDLLAELSRETSQLVRKELEQNEIAHTRAEMSETIEAIHDRLRPSRLVSDVTGKVKAVTSER